MARYSRSNFFDDGSLPMFGGFWDSLTPRSVGDQNAGDSFLRLPADARLRILVPIAAETVVPAARTESQPIPSPSAAPVSEADLPFAGIERSATMAVGAIHVADADFQALLPQDGAAYFVQYSDDLQSGIVINAVNRTLLPGGPGDWPALGGGADDTLVLAGDFSGGAMLPGAPLGLDAIVATGASDYILASRDFDVATGASLTVNAMPITAGHHIAFDGGAETDGRFDFLGSGSGDSFIGGAGNDSLYGAGGADHLTGGGGNDIFVYFVPSDSTGPNYDTLTDFDPANDRIDLPGNVTGFAAPADDGSLSLASFDADLAAALGGLGAGQAAWFAPDSGDLAGKIFLVVDANGQPGYQAGQDYVIAVDGHPLADLTGHPTIFG